MQYHEQWLCALHVPHAVRHHTARTPQHSMSVHKATSVVSGEEEDLDLGKMVREGEVAWLHKADMPGSASASGCAEHAQEVHEQAWHAQRQRPHSPDQAAVRKRKDPPAGRYTYSATRPALAHAGCPTLTMLTDQLVVRCKVICGCMFVFGSPWCQGCSPCVRSLWWSLQLAIALAFAASFLCRFSCWPQQCFQASFPARLVYIYHDTHSHSFSMSGQCLSVHVGGKAQVCICQSVSCLHQHVRKICHPGCHFAEVAALLQFILCLHPSGDMSITWGNDMLQQCNQGMLSGRTRRCRERSRLLQRQVARA